MPSRDVSARCENQSASDPANNNNITLSSLSLNTLPGPFYLLSTPRAHSIVTSLHCLFVRFFKKDHYDTFYCVVDLHAVTAPHNPKELADATLSAAAVRGRLGRCCWGNTALSVFGWFWQV
jgi:hypothetical protein